MAFFKVFLVILFLLTLLTHGRFVDTWQPESEIFPLASSRGFQKPVRVAFSVFYTIFLSYSSYLFAILVRVLFFCLGLLFCGLIFLTCEGFRSLCVCTVIC